MNVGAQLAFATALILMGHPALAENVHGVLRVVKGDVKIQSVKKGQLIKARIGEQVFPRDVILIGKDSRAKIVMVDNNEINISPESQVEIQHYEFDPAAGKKDVLLNVIYGKVRAKVEQKYDGKSAKFQVKTPSAVAGVRGTDFLASFNRANSHSQVVTFQGKVEFGSIGPNGTIVNPVFITPGNTATSVNGAAPAAPVPLPKTELAKMDKDTNADTKANQNDGGSKDRQPSGDKSKKEDGKKDQAKGPDKDSARQPASNNSAGPKEGSTLREGDLVGGGDVRTPGPLPLGPAPLPAFIAPNPALNNLPVCDFCTRLIESGNSNLRIRVQSN